VVLVGPYEHHSNDLPWRKSIADVVAIGEDRDGGVDLTELETALVCLAVAALLHRHGALSLWDYTAAAPYVPIRMGESASGRGDHKDAVFFSPHKFVGGPQTPGVLVVRRELVGDRAPIVPGGGTIAFVSPSGRVYLDDPVAREEGRHPRLLSAQHTTDDVARFLANFAAFAAALRP
jgi:selenocysteine lyase/cysteine desulfurase